MIVKLNECIFLLEDDELLEKYNGIWVKVSPSNKKEVDSKRDYKKNF